MKRRVHRAAPGVGLGLLAGAVAVGVTWPVVCHLGDSSYEMLAHTDVQCGLWWPRAFADSLVHAQNPFHRPELNWPEGQDTNLLLWNYGVQLLFTPLHRLVDDPLRAFNLMNVAILVLDGLGAGLAARLAGSRWPGVVLATVFGASSNYAVAEAGTGRPEQGLWAPVAIYLGAIAWLLREPGNRRSRWTAAGALAYSGAVYWFYAHFLVFLTLVLAAGLALTRRLDRRGQRDLAFVGVTSRVLVAPFLAPVVQGCLDQPGFYTRMRESGLNPVFARQSFSITLPWSLMGVLSPRWQSANRMLPVVAVPLLGWAAWRGPRGVRAVALAGLMAVVMAAGPFIMSDRGSRLHVGGRVLALPDLALGRWLPGYDRFSWPYRWQGVTLGATAVALGALASRARIPVVLALGAWISFEGGALLRARRNGTRPAILPAHVPEVFTAIGHMGGFDLWSHCLWPPFPTDRSAGRSSTTSPSMPVWRGTSPRCGALATRGGAGRCPCWRRWMRSAGDRRFPSPRWGPTAALAGGPRLKRVAFITPSSIDTWSDTGRRPWRTP